MNDDLITLSYRCMADEADTLLALCESNDISVSDFITQALLMYLDIVARSPESIPPEIYNRIFPDHG